VVIEPAGRFGSFRFGELWEYRELLQFLVWRDIKIRYKQTLLGAAWAILQPVLAALVFTLFFGTIAGISSASTSITRLSIPNAATALSTCSHVSIVALPCCNAVRRGRDTTWVTSAGISASPRSLRTKTTPWFAGAG
jgi:hypothetical protein